MYTCLHYRMKSKGKKSAVEENADFVIDTSDNRFQSLLKSNVYAIDPTSTEYKPTPAMKQLLQQQQSRLVQEQQRADGWKEEGEGNVVDVPESGMNPSHKKTKLNPVSELANKVKQKFNSKK